MPVVFNNRPIYHNAPLTESERLIKVLEKIYAERAMFPEKAHEYSRMISRIQDSILRKQARGE